MWPCPPNSSTVDPRRSPSSELGLGDSSPPSYFYWRNVCFGGLSWKPLSWSTRSWLLVVVVARIDTILFLILVVTIEFQNVAIGGKAFRTNRNVFKENVPYVLMR